MLVKAVRRVYWLCENSVTRFELSTIYTHMFFLTACWNDIYRILQHFIFNRSLFLCCHIHIFWTYQMYVFITLFHTFFTLDCLTVIFLWLSIYFTRTTCYRNCPTDTLNDTLHVPTIFFSHLPTLNQFGERFFLTGNSHFDYKFARKFNDDVLVVIQ